MVKKSNMVQKFRHDGSLVAATVCQAAPCFIIGLKTEDKDGYWAVQLGGGKKKKPNKPLKGMAKKGKLDFAPEIIREFRIGEGDLPKLGEKMTVEKVISPGFLIDVAGVTKGRGFAGVIKRWGFHSHPKTHGQKGRERAPGSIGPQTPGRVIKGKKMPGHLGNVRRTIKNLEVLAVDEKKEEVLIKGAIPGPKNSWLVLSVKKKSKKFIPLAE